MYTYYFLILVLHLIFHRNLALYYIPLNFVLFYRVSLSSVFPVHKLFLDINMGICFFFFKSLFERGASSLSIMFFWVTCYVYMVHFRLMKVMSFTNHSVPHMLSKCNIKLNVKALKFFSLLTFHEF